MSPSNLMNFDFSFATSLMQAAERRRECYPPYHVLTTPALSGNPSALSGNPPALSGNLTALLAAILGKKGKYLLDRVLMPLLRNGQLLHTIPAQPNHPDQAYTAPASPAP